MIRYSRHKEYKIKVCGMQNPENIRDLINLNLIDFIGFIFYEKSPRAVKGDLPPTPGVKRVGVFVNENRDEIIKITKRHNLDLVQLHGDETPEDCAYYRSMGLEVIKVFPVRDTSDLKPLNEYKKNVDYFLFDTKTEKRGGSGVSFDWNILKDYDLEIPYFLSGGLNLENINEAVKMNLPGCEALDLNSGFEASPGVKDIDKLEKLNHLGYEISG